MVSIINSSVEEKGKGEKIMKAKMTKLVALLFTMTFAISALSAIQVSADPTTIEIINPLTGDGNFIFDTNTLGLGDTFLARVIVTDVTGLWQFQVLVGFDPALLNVVSMTYTSDIGDYVFDGIGTIPVTPEIDNVVGYVIGGVNSLDAGNTFTGSGTLCMITFEVMAEPERYGVLGPSTIDLITTGTNTKKPGFYTFVADSDMTELDYTGYDATYQFSWAAPTTLPWLEVDPSYKKVGGGAPITITPIYFTVDILIHNVDPEWQLVAVQFRLVYDPVLLNATAITEGTFMNDPVWAPEGTVFASSNDNSTNPWDPYYGYGQASVGIIIWPPGGEWSAPFPEGDGLLCSITFQVMHQEEFPWIGTSDLNLEKLIDLGGNPSAYFFDSDFVDINNGPDTDGRIDVMGYILGLQIDVYTQYAYIDPELGGVGPDSPSDAFAPQATVILEAKVTYNLDPVQFKIVNFYIVGPSGEFEHYRSVMTDADGVARMEYGLPWPCENYSDCFGIWNVFASVEVRESIENDTLQFRVGWLVEILDVTPLKTDWTKGEHLTFTIHYKTISKQDRSGIITMVVYDNLLVPIGQLPAIPFTVGDAPLLGEKEYYVNMTCLTIPKWAFIGPAVAYTNAFTEYPQLGGIAYCPEVATEITIVKV